MIRADVSRAETGAQRDKPFIFTARNASALLRELPPDALVRVTVLSARGDGTARVRIGERTFVAAGLQRLVEGDSFDARISVVDDAVFVTPERERIDGGGADVFRSLGLPETPVSAFVVSFFRTIGRRLDPASLRSVLKSAARFPHKELRAAEAAAILVERGISPDDATVERMLRVMDGAGSDAGNDEDCEHDRDFCAFVNHKKGQDLHWIVIPFRNDIAGTPCAGSIRFLLDTTRNRSVECRISVRAGSHDWDFSLTDAECTYAVNPEFPSVVFGQLVVYLRRCLEDAGITSVKAAYPGGYTLDNIKSIDLEI